MNITLLRSFLLFFFFGYTFCSVAGSCQFVTDPDANSDPQILTSDPGADPGGTKTYTNPMDPDGDPEHCYIYRTSFFSLHR
jgi:hypothetical protein